MFNYLNPSFSVFGLEIHWYAICILIGILVAVYAGIKEGKKLGIPSDYVYTGVLFILPCAIIGTRLWWVLFNLDKIHSFIDVIAIWDGGLAIQGGIIATIISLIAYCKIRKISIYRIVDIVAPGFFIGQIFGRFGNFFNHELYGPIVKNVELFKNILPNFITENMFINGFYRHPTFLYESILNLVGLVIILVCRNKWKRVESGDAAGLYLVWYGLVRCFTESLRAQSGANEILMVGPISVSILVSIIFIFAGIAFLVVKRFVGPRTNYLELKKTIKENRYDTILFDLDGTLLNTRDLINRSFIHTFAHFRPEKQLTDEELDSFFGPSLRQTFSRYSKDEKEIAEMIAYYREFNVVNHDEFVTAFSGAKWLVKSLANKGYKIGVVSSKKTDLVEHGLDLFGMLKYMKVVIGEEDVKNPKPDPEGINKAVRMLDSKKALYVGDGIGDIEAGKNANIDTIGVLYSNRKEAIIAANPTYVIENLNQILTILVE